MLLLTNQMASGLFRTIAAVGRNMVVANTFGSFVLLLLFVLGGFVLSRGIISVIISLISRLIFILKLRPQ